MEEYELLEDPKYRRYSVRQKNRPMRKFGCVFSSRAIFLAPIVYKKKLGRELAL
jgi:hypothetical protein